MASHVTPPASPASLRPVAAAYQGSRIDAPCQVEELEQAPVGVWTADVVAHPVSPGPWLAHKMVCNLSRNALGAWSGCVVLPTTHPLFGCMELDTMRALVPDVHGGITRVDGFCVWFDCSHAGDAVPLHAKETSRLLRLLRAGSDAVYWTLADARAETERLAAALDALRSLAREDVGSRAQSAMPHPLAVTF